MKRNLIADKFAAFISVVLICLVLIVTPLALTRMEPSYSSSFTLSNGMYSPNGGGSTVPRLYLY